MKRGSARPGRGRMIAPGLLLATAAWACSGDPTGGVDEHPTPTPAPAAVRIVAVGDLHGDATAAREALRLGGLVDEAGNWAGGDAVLVQVGDVLDRGDREKDTLELLDRLEAQAEEAGGKVHALLGNHEFINVAGDYRYTSPANLAAFPVLESDVPAELLALLPPPHRGRGSAFLPGGYVTRKLADHDVAVVVGDNAFAHAGILPEHVIYGLDLINGEAHDWLSGRRPDMPEILADRRRSPVWTRLYCGDPLFPQEVCDTLDDALDLLGAKRMIVGHTVQDGGITSGCGGRIWCIDVGMSSFYEGASVEVLEIVGDRVTPLRARRIP